MYEKKRMFPSQFEFIKRMDNVLIVKKESETEGLIQKRVR
jgi:hypothetical protein